MKIKNRPIFMSCLAQYITSSTSVRRNRRSAMFYCLAQKKITRKLLYCIITGIFFSLPFFSNAQPGKQTASLRKIIIYFQNTVGEKRLNTDSVYKNNNGETFSVRSFKYYVSNIVMQDDATGKTESYPSEYFLIDEEDSTSKQIELTTSLEHISSLHFLLGVDSLKNVSGIQSGNLDPSRGMFWTWNTGYVMAKLEGNSPLAKTPGHMFSYHVGGYKQNEKTERLITLNLPQLLDAKRGDSITISANILAWFSGANDIKIETVSFCHEPGALAVKFADNYANMFSITAIE